MATTILLNSDELMKYSLIGGNLDTDRILPSIKTSQELVIKPMLGSDLYVKVCEDFETDTLAGKYLELYNDFIRPILIHSSSELYLQVGAYSVTNIGITKGSTENSEPVDKNEVDYLVQNMRNIVESYKRDFLEWIKLNYNDLPEYDYTKCNTSEHYLYVGGWRLRRVSKYGRDC